MMVESTFVCIVVLRVAIIFVLVIVLWLPPNERENRNRDTLGIQPSQEIHLYFHAAFGPSGRHVTPTGLRFHHVEQRVCMRFYKSILTYVLLQAQWRSGT